MVSKPTPTGGLRVFSSSVVPQPSSPHAALWRRPAWKALRAGLIVNTCTGYLCPVLSSYIAEDLGLKTSIRFLGLMGMGCGAAISNLEGAAGMLARSGEGPVLSLAVEICSAAIFPSHEPELVVSNSIFGDGAAAVLDLSREGPHATGQAIFSAAGTVESFRLASWADVLRIPPLVGIGVPPGVS
jgi:predicted naringenin-chalcone synthase